MTAAKAGQGPPKSDLPYGKKVWPKATVKSRFDLAERTLLEVQTEGEPREIKAWYDAQFADWKVYKQWNKREIAVLMNGEWKAWSRQNVCCLVAVHDKEKRGGMTVAHAFDREEELQEFLAEIPEEVAHREKCKRNLQTIESAKAQATRKYRLASGSAATTEQVSALIPGGCESLLCPDSGAYTIGTLGQPSRCSAHGTQMAMGRR
jgi:hypothetical protein